MKAIGYIRVSTEGQAAEGVSLEAQTDRIERYCTYAGLELTGVIEDAGVSGGLNRSRAGFVELLTAVETGAIGAVVVYRLDRLSRDMLTLLSLERLLNENGVALHTVEGQVSTGTPDGYMGFAMTALMGEMERRNAGARTRSALQYKRNRGEVVGGIPYGFRRVGDRLEFVEEEQAVIKQADTLYSRGCTLAAICRELTAQGTRTRTGKAFTPQQVKRMLPDYQPRWTKSSRVNQEIKSFLLAIA